MSYRHLITLILAAAAVLGCTKKEAEEQGTLSVDPAELTLTGNNPEKPLQINSSTTWTVSASENWLHADPAKGEGDQEITVKADRYSGSGFRKAKLTVAIKGKQEVVSVTQYSFSEVLTVTPEEVHFTGDVLTASVEVASNTDWRTITEESWISCNPAEGNGSATVTITAQPITQAEGKREGKVAFKYGDVRVNVKVSQSFDDGLFSGGTGTSSAPYLISTVADLQQLSSLSNDSKTSKKLSAAHFQQTADINMDGVSGFVPLFQAQSDQFAGVYDGASHKILGLEIKPKAQKASGFVAYSDGGTVKDLNLAAIDVDAPYVYCGAIVGHSLNSTVSNCNVTGKVRQYTSGINATGSNNEGYSGGLAGYAEGSTFEHCTLDGSVTIYGLYGGGLIGFIKNTTVSDCHLLKENTVNIYYHFNGGLIGRMDGASSVVSGCSFEGNLTAVGYFQGGIVGEMRGGRVENCVMGSYASIGCDKYCVGGIVGAAVPIDEIVIDHCAAYGTIKGFYSVGGIVGYSGYRMSTPGALSNATKPITISNCAYLGGELTATGNNGGTNAYSIAAGVLGWSHGGNNLLIKGCYSNPSVLQTTSTGNRGALAGIIAYQNSTGSCTIKDCYSTVTPSTMLTQNDQITSLGTEFYGGLYCRFTKGGNISSCWCDNSIKIGTGDATESGTEQLTTAQLADGTLLGKLQAAADGTVWVAGANGLPTIQDLPADPTVKPKAAKRVSVIGDSISTFKGWIPGGYSAHYPATDGTLTLVNETYWYRLIHDYMKSATLDMNIAFSGSTVTNTTDENYQKRYGSATNAWFKKDFVTRFIECGGCGRPDIILIHGGTNDWAHNADPLAPGVAIRNDASNIYGGSKPSASIMKAIYDKADAATTRSEINALPDGTFCEAYAKLLCQIRERYPQCKVVCIIGDYLSSSIEESVLDIAEHYGAKTVNLFRVNGFNDLGGYSPETLKNKGTQPNMPKHDYSGDLGGCHPGSQAMVYIANKIYTELGAWLEQ